MTGITPAALVAQHQDVDEKPLPATALGRRIAELLAKRGISINRANQRSGLSTGYLSRVLAPEGKETLRKQPGPDKVEALAAALETTFDYLSRGVGPVDAPPVPSGWDFGRRGMAMRILAGRGKDHAVVQGAAERVLTRFGGVPGPNEPMQTMTLIGWVKSIEGEIEQPTPAADIVALQRVPQSDPAGRTESLDRLVHAVSKDATISAEEAGAIVGRLAYSDQYRNAPTFELYREAMRIAEPQAAYHGTHGGVDVVLHGSVAAEDVGELTTAAEQEGTKLPKHPRKRASPKRHER